MLINGLISSYITHTQMSRQSDWEKLLFCEACTVETIFLFFCGPNKPFCIEGRPSEWLEMAMKAYIQLNWKMPSVSDIAAGVAMPPTIPSTGEKLWVDCSVKVGGGWETAPCCCCKPTSLHNLSQSSRKAQERRSYQLPHKVRIEVPVAKINDCLPS